MRASLVLAALLLAGCGDLAESADSDPYWTDTTPDTSAPEKPLAMQTQRVTVVPGKTKDAELVPTLAVGRSEHAAERRIVMRLSPGELPSLAAGDRLITPAEVEVTTRCDVGQVAPGCNYNPTVRAQLLLTGSRDDTSGAGPSRVIATQTQSCTHEEHHCVFAFLPAEASLDLGGAGGLPCLAGQSCYVNLVMWAWDPAARPDGVDKVLVGQNDGDYLENGKVDGDSGRLMAVRERGITAADRAERESGGHGDLGVNLHARPEVVYSHALAAGDLVAGEQFVIEAKIVAAVTGRARFSTQLVLTRNPHGTENDVPGVTPSAPGEGNGVNCTPGESPCERHKVAVLRADRAIAGPVYVNVIVQSEVPGGAPAAVTIRRGDGWVRSVRYGARLY